MSYVVLKEIVMRSVHNVLLAVCTSFVFLPSLHASGLEDILRQGTGVVVDTQRNKSTAVIDAERRKQAIDIDAQRQVNSFAVLIDSNVRHIDEELDPQVMDTRVELRALERDRAKGRVTYGEYLGEKRTLDARMNDLRSSIVTLKRQNQEYEKRQKEILSNAEAQKKQVDVDLAANAGQATTRQNSSILEQIIRGIGR